MELYYNSVKNLKLRNWANYNAYITLYVSGTSLMRNNLLNQFRWSWGAARTRNKRFLSPKGILNAIVQWPCHGRRNCA